MDRQIVHPRDDFPSYLKQPENKLRLEEVEVALDEKININILSEKKRNKQ